jgi:uncharacterized protein YndB with AHSA1/START domain
METLPFVIEMEYDIPVDKVWKAISDPGDMKQWYFDLPSFTSKVGVPAEFEMVEEPDNMYLDKCTAVEKIELKKISYAWKYEAYPGNSMVTFELSGEPDKTKLRFTHEGLETFPVSNPDMARDNIISSWRYMLDTAIKVFLEDR